MQRYYFDFRQDAQLTPDNLGCEFSSVEDAYLEAFNAAREIWVELLNQRRDPRRCSFEVHDGTGSLLFVLPFWEVLESCRNYPRARSTLLDTFRQTMHTVRHIRRAHEEFVQEMESAQQTLRESARLIAETELIATGS